MSGIGMEWIHSQTNYSIKLLHGYVVNCELCECSNHAGREGLMFAGIYAIEEF